MAVLLCILTMPGIISNSCLFGILQILCTFYCNISLFRLFRSFFRDFIVFFANLDMFAVSHFDAFLTRCPGGWIVS